MIMAGRHKWSEIEKKMGPKRLAAAKKAVREDLEHMMLAEIRRLVGLTQQQVADELDVTQAAVSHLENQMDMHISTLQRIVRALGGDLEIVVNLPTGRISLSQFDDAA